MTKTRRVAVVGLGHWYSAYGLARALPEYPRAELVVAAEPDPQSSRRRTADLRRRGGRRLREVIARDDIDIVHIASPVATSPT